MSTYRNTVRFLGIMILVLAVPASASVVIKSGSSTNTQNVDSNNNANVVTPTSPANSGFVKSTDDANYVNTGTGAFSGVPRVGSGKGRLKVGQDSILLYDPIDASNIQANVWAISFNTTGTAYTIAQATGTLTINSTNAVTATSMGAIWSVNQFQRPMAYPICFRTIAKVPNQTITNGEIDLGFGSWATMATVATGTITDGAWFKFTASGFFAVSTFNSVDTTSSALTAPTAANFHSFMVCRKATGIDYYVDDLAVTSIANPTANPTAVSVSHLPVFYRAFDSSGSVSSAAPRIDIGESAVFQEDLAVGTTVGEQLSSGAARNAALSPVTTFLQTANHANSTSPSTFTVSNTAAGYTTLGGRWQVAAAGGATTDAIVYGFQVPTGFQLNITGIGITNCNTGAAVATTGTLFDWSLGVNSSAVSLATADGAAAVNTAQTWSPRRIPIGVQGLALGAAVEACANNIWQPFNPPVTADSGRFVHVILQMPIGTATGSEIFRGDVIITGYFK